MLIIFNNNLVGGLNLPLWKMMDFVSWDDDFPNIWKNKKGSKPTNQIRVIMVDTILQSSRFWYMWYVYHSQSWVVNLLALFYPTLYKSR